MSAELTNQLRFLVSVRSMTALSDIVHYSDQYLRVAEVEDYPNALNGLQIENSGAVTKLGAAVDASTATLKAAADQQINFLLVHHGMFWPGLQPIAGPLRRQLKFAIENDIALYSAHLPLDVHAEVGNNIQLARSLGFEKSEPFLELKGQPIGRKVSVALKRDELIARLKKLLSNRVQCVGAGPAETRAIGIVTGGAGGEIYAAAREGIDTFITGEAPHWAAVAAEELAVNLLIGGHYATETFGVKAFAAHLSDKFKVPWEFIDHPSGL
jgi:dinuclear metal center YbgI/SA1388 family protein